MLRRTAGLPLAVLLLGSSTVAAQQGLIFNRTGSGARAAGMANAFIAVSDDGTAASWNPAGLGQLRKPELSIVSTTIGQSLRNQGFRTRDDASAFTTAVSSYRSTSLDFASLAVPVTLAGKPTTFQGAWRRIYALDYRANFSTTREPLAPEAPASARIDSNNDVRGAVDLISLAGAAKLTSRLAIGASFNIWRGDWTEDNVINETPLDQSSPSVFLATSQTNRIRGNNFTLGLMLTYPRWRIGLVHQTELSSDFDSQARVTTSSTPSASFQVIDGTLRFPRAVGLGGAWQPAARWTVALDFTWDEWRDAELETPVTGRLNFFDSLPEDRTSTRNTLSVNAGAEHVFPGEGFVVPLRFGVAWEPQGGRSPYTLDPVNYVMLAIGTGYNTNSLKFDAAFQFRRATFQDGAGAGLGFTPSPELPPAIGERAAREWRLKLSLILRIADSDKLHRALRRMFGG